MDEGVLGMKGVGYFEDSPPALGGDGGASAALPSVAADGGARRAKWKCEVVKSKGPEPARLLLPRFVQTSGREDGQLRAGKEAAPGAL